MIYKITLENPNLISKSFDYLQKNGDFLLYDSNIILHSDSIKSKITSSLRKIYGKDFTLIVKELHGREILLLPNIVSKWHSHDISILEQSEVINYQQQALSILNEVVEQMLNKGGEINAEI